MIGDIGIVVFALIGILAKKRWAAIVATIWFSVGVFTGLIFDFPRFGPTIKENSAIFAVIIQIVLIIGAWIRSWKK